MMIISEAANLFYHKKDKIMAQYSEKAQALIKETMHRWKEGTLKSSNGDVVKDRQQALAISISEAREKGYKVSDDYEQKKA